MSPDFDFWEHDDEGEDSSSDQIKDCIHRKIVSPSIPGIPSSFAVIL